MSLLYPFVLSLLGSRLGTHLAARAGHGWVRPWASWPACAAISMAATLATASVTHFKEPQRSGLVAIVPDMIPCPALVVTATGVIEAGLALALLHPRARRPAAVAAIALLLALYPANVVAARGLDHPHAPHTALVPRTALQALLVGTCFVAARATAEHAHKPQQGRSRG